MGKGIKIALAILYAVQVVVIFRESIDHLRSRGHEDEHGDSKQNIAQAQTPHDTRVLFKRAFQPIFKHQGLLAAAPLAGTLTVTALTGIRHETDHIHPPEEKKKGQAALNRHKRPRWRERLIANLYPLLKKFEPPAAPDLTNICLIAANRALVFPAAR